MRIDLIWKGSTGRHVPGWPTHDFALIDEREAAPAEGSFVRVADPEAVARALVAGGHYSKPAAKKTTRKPTTTEEVTP